jgi:alanine racemase
MVIKELNNMSRPTYLKINPEALLHNVQQVKQHAVGKKIIAMVKSNAYGCDVSIVVPALSKVVDAFGVACIEEALIVRIFNHNLPCILFQGVFSQSEYHLAAAQNFPCVIHNQQQLNWLITTPLENPLSVWIKVNTGLNRLGFDAAEVDGVFATLKHCSWVNEIGLMTHFSRADEPENEYNTTQIRMFDQITPEITLRSMGNSAAILAHMQLKADYVRPGIMLYGVSPFAEKNANELGLQPVMSLNSIITTIHHYPPHTYVGYGATWSSSRPSIIGVVPVGYGDGYPRHIAANTPVLINGQLAPIVGRVSMDMITVDLTDCHDVHLGDAVELWGESLPVEVIARAAGTIAYELLCQVSDRVRMKNLV